MDCKNCKHHTDLPCGHTACVNPNLDPIYEDTFVLLMALSGAGFSAIPAKIKDGKETECIEVDELDIKEGRVIFPFHFDPDLIKRCLWREEDLLKASVLN